MSNWQLVNSENHIHSGWVPPTGYPQAQKDSVAPLLVSEMSRAIAYYPMVFLKNGEGEFRLHALLSFEPSLNVFVHPDNGKWLAPYVPAAYRSNPFEMVVSPSNELVLVVDEASIFYQPEKDENGKSILSEEGALSDSLIDTAKFIRARYEESRRTALLVGELSSCDLLKEWPLAIKLTNEMEKEQKISGLYRIDESKLRSLSGATLSKLAQSGALDIAYAQMFSQDRIKDLEMRFTHFKSNIAPSNPQAIEEVDLDRFFSEQPESDIFSF